MNWSRKAAGVLLIVGFFLSLAIGLAPRAKEPPPLLNPASYLKAMPPFDPSSIDHAAREFDGTLDKIISADNLQITGPADWLTICRRISLGLMGSGMSLEDIRFLEQFPQENRASVFLESCLADARWSNYWSERFTRAYVGDNNGPFLLYRRRKFRLWLADQLASDRPYDALVRQLITAKGLWTDHPEVNFYTATADGDENNRADPIRMAGRVSRVFLAKRIDCLQCHDDFVGNTSLASDEGMRSGTQIDFHRLAAFFDGVAVKNIVAGIDDDGRQYAATLLGQTEQTEIDPQVPFDEKLYNDDLPRREAIANWLTNAENDHFSRATVNRVWGLMTGRPLVAPVDDIAEDATLIGPLDSLAHSFVANGYSLKHLIRTIAATQTFQRDSRSEVFEITPEHETVLASFPIVRLRPEQVALSVFQTTHLSRLSDTSNILEQLGRSDELGKFLKDFGDLGDKELNGISTTVTQKLLLLNGNAITAATKLDLVENAVSRIGQFAKDEDSMTEQVYLTFVNRFPTSTERSAIRAACRSDKQDNSKAENNQAVMAIDLAYALINSAEFQWNH
jgi:hypothetical protein